MLLWVKGVIGKLFLVELVGIERIWKAGEKVLVELKCCNNLLPPFGI